MRSSATSGGANEIALIAKENPGPYALMSRPEAAGPSNAPTWKIDELSPIALRMCSSGTNSVTKDWRVGLSIEMTVPVRNASTYTWPTWT